MTPKSKKPVFIYYNVWVNMVHERSLKYCDNWELRYTFLNETDALLAAKYDKIKEDRIKKLINHPSRKFTCMKNRRANIIKIFSEVEITYVSLHEQIMEQARKILAES